MRRIQIVDLDGCISDDRWRRHLIGAHPTDRYHEYHKHALRDDPANLHEIAGFDRHVIITGRPVRYREITLMWLCERVGIHPLFLLMRNNNDYRPAAELKPMMLNALFDYNSYGVHREEIADCIDDMEGVVNGYRALGFPFARIVRIGDEEHAHG